MHRHLLLTAHNFRALLSVRSKFTPASVKAINDCDIDLVDTRLSARRIFLVVVSVGQKILKVCRCMREHISKGSATRTHRDSPMTALH